MIKIEDVIRIQQYALAHSFSVSIMPDNNGNLQEMKFEFGDRELVYRPDDNAVFIEGIEFSGNFNAFEVELEILRIFETLGHMILGAVVEKTEGESV